MMLFIYSYFFYLIQLSDGAIIHRHQPSMLCIAVCCRRLIPPVRSAILWCCVLAPEALLALSYHMGIALSSTDFAIIYSHMISPSESAIIFCYHISLPTGYVISWHAGCRAHLTPCPIAAPEAAPFPMRSPSL